jgi:hypothetical protein
MILNSDQKGIAIIEVILLMLKRRTIIAYEDAQREPGAVKMTNEKIMK